MFHVVHTALHAIAHPVDTATRAGKGLVSGAKKLTGIISSTREDAH